MSANDNYVVVGKITGVFGVKGWVKVYSFTEPMEAISDYPNWYIASPKGWQPLDLEQRRWQGGKLIALVRGTYDRDEAKVFTGRELAVEKAALPELEEDEYYWHQLQGLKAYSVNPQDPSQQPILLGEVKRMMETGANDVLVVKACEGSVDKNERLIPYLPDRVVLDIDLEGGTIKLDWDPDY